MLFYHQLFHQKMRELQAVFSLLAVLPTISGSAVKLTYDYNWQGGYRAFISIIFPANVTSWKVLIILNRPATSLDLVGKLCI